MTDLNIIAIKQTELTEYDNGALRLWVQGLDLLEAGFEKTTPIKVEKDIENTRLVITPCELEEKTNTVSGKMRRALNTYMPIIDVKRKDLKEFFSGQVTVVVTILDRLIYVTVHHEERARLEREQRLMEHLKQGYITEGVACAGIGVSALAMDQGLREAGLKTKMKWVVDESSDYLNVFMKNNPAYNNTMTVQARIEALDCSMLPRVDAMQISLPCTGHSKAGKSKNKIKNAEQHDTGATSVFGMMNIQLKTNPAIITSENVVEAQDSATYDLIRRELTRRGYVIHEKILSEKDAGSVEKRRRYYFIAISKGIKQFNLDNMPVFGKTYATVMDMLDTVPFCDKAFSQNQYLKDKAVRDKADGKGFANRQLLTGEESHYGTIGRHYMKRRSTEPFILGPNFLERLLTPIEHARGKDIPPVLINGIGGTLAHEGLGQSILFNHMVAIALRIGGGLLSWMQEAGNDFCGEKACDVIDGNYYMTKDVECTFTPSQDDVFSGDQAAFSF